MGMADEHFIPGTSRITEIESFHRYCAAAELCKGCTVLDAASGDGYGSALLAEAAAQVTGVDLNQQAVEEASRKYTAENLSFVHADAAALPFADNSFDRVVSFETIEHIPDQEKFLNEVRRVLRPDGVLILSSPNKTPFRTRNKGENAYHIRELEEDALKELLSRFFPRVSFYCQDAFYSSVITGGSGTLYYVKDLENRIIKQESLKQVQYTIVIASEKEPPVLPASSYLDASFDPEKGYLLDDESVVNQFGLRGEFERAWSSLADLKQEFQVLGEEKNHCTAQNQLLTETVASLQQTNEALSRENDSQTEKNRELAGVLTNVSQIIEDIRQTNEQLNSGFRDKTEESIAQQKIIAELREENQQLNRELRDRAEENSGLLKNSEELNNANTLIYSELQNKTWENGELRKKIEKLESSSAECCSELKSQTDVNAELRKTLEELENTNAQCCSELKSQSEENAELRKTIEELENTNAQCCSELKSQTDVNAELRKTIEELENTNTQCCSELKSQTDVNAELRKTLEELENTNAQCCSELKSQSDVNAELRKTIEELENTNAQCCSELKSQTGENAELRKTIEELENTNAQCCSELKSQSEENAGLKKSLEELEAEKVHLENEVQTRSCENRSLQKSLEELQKDNDRAFCEFQAKSQESYSLKKSCEELERKLQLRIRENAEQQKTISDTNRQCRKLEIECQRRNEENAGLKKFIEELQQINHKLIEKNNMMSQENQQLSANLAAIQQELSQTQERLQELKQQLEALKSTSAQQQQALADANEALAAKDEMIDGLRHEWNEEHAKAEYLYGEYLDLKDSLSYKLLGRWRLRKKMKNLLCYGAKGVHRVGKSILRACPGNYSSKMALKNKIYSRFGGLLRDVPGYQVWQLHHEGLKMLELEKDTGLIIPEDIPLTSIVIPVYNNIELTRRCLHSIYGIKSVSPFEVIIVDDCSTDDYESLKKDFPLIRLIRNEVNSGFLLTVNRGAKEARGEYLLILNNDTEVAPGWLDELTCALYRHPEAGMIGSALIHLRTGTLQESGNLICKNGDMMPLGRGESPDHPRFTYFREVDFCSAASIILRTKVFVEEMDGFDRIYVPAYFEDPDLGLRLKKAGYKNYVCPMSRVLHQEMASYGDALDDKCAKNRGIFMDRWREYLEENALYRDRSEPGECMKFPRPRIMYIDAETPMADRGSGGMDAIFFMEYMIKRGYEVVFHGEYTPGYTPKYTTILLRMGVECVYAPQRQIWEYLESAGWTFSYIFVSRIYQARCFDRLLKKYCPQAAYIFDTVDVHFVREELEAELKNDDELRKLAADTKKYELATAAAADATIVISSDEKKLLEEEYHLTNVYHIPQARELFGLAPNPNRRGAVFIGSAHPPNLDGLRHFHDDILPLLPRNFRLTIIGEALKTMIGKIDEYKDLLRCPQFNFVGFVQDLGTELNNAKITIAPLRYGAGTKGKVASSMAYGVPCVSSSFGTEGTGMVHGDNIMIAHSPQEFADYINQLCSDQELWQKISDGGIKFIRDNYAPETVEKMMDVLFAEVTERRQQQRSDWASKPVMPKVDEV